MGKKKAVHIRNEALLQNVRTALERGLGVRIPASAIIEASLLDEQRRIRGELVPFDNALAAVEAIVKVRVEMAVGAFLGETNPGEEISVLYDAAAGQMTFRIGSADPYHVFFNPNNPNDSFSETLREIAQLESVETSSRNDGEAS